ncbi:hypothetical protein, partial [Streptomyces sp. NRRL B-24572]|uniref:hypothetical protein n=1 Tax=Streptomyces sp. NRRL B-24572 TaxID=1962156 RepID=UPI00118085A0
MADQHDEILGKIAEVKKELDEVKKEVSTPKAATSTDLDNKTKEIIEAVKGGKDEKKAWWEAIIEGLGFKDVLAAFKDQTALTSAIPLAIGALGVLLVGKLFDLGKLFNAALEPITRAIGRRRGNASSEGRILTLGDNGLPTFQRRAQAEAAPIIAMAASTLTPTELGNLKSALEAVNPHIRTFNSNVRGMPSNLKMRQAAKALDKLNPAITTADPDKIDQTATKVTELATAVQTYNTHRLDVRELGKVNKAVDKAKPDKIRDIAKATGKLAGALRHFNPSSLPNAATLSTSARAASQLADAGRDVARAFNDLKLAAHRAAQEIAPTT